MKGNVTLNGFAIMTNHLHIVLQEKATIEYKKYKTVS